MKPIALRASDEERGSWEEAAGNAGLKLSQWLRRAANEQADLERVLDERQQESRATRISPDPKFDPPTVEQIRDKMYPQKRKRCIHRLHPGTYCKKCDTTK